VAGRAVVDITYRGGAELVPQGTRPRPGDPSCGLRLLNWREDGGRFVATVEGSGQHEFRVRSSVALRDVEGGRIGSRTGPFTTIIVELSASGERRRVMLAP